MKNKKVNVKIQKAAEKLLNLFGPKGQHWLNGYSQDLFDPVLPVLEFHFYNEESENSNFDNTPEFNDRDGFKPIRTFLKLLKNGVNPENIFIAEDGTAQTAEIVKKSVKVN
jgi:hypothetical protein